MIDETGLAEISAKLTELNRDHTADLARLESKLQEICSILQTLREEINSLGEETADPIAFS